MSPSPEARRLARERAAQRRRHVQRIRRTVVVVSVTVFIALFSTIYIQLAAGRDPALTAGKQSTAMLTTTTSGADATSSASSSTDSSSEDSTSDDTTLDDSSSDDSSSDDPASQSTDQPSAVTTSQS